LCIVLTPPAALDFDITCFAALFTDRWCTGMGDLCYNGHNVCSFVGWILLVAILATESGFGWKLLVSVV